MRIKHLLQSDEVLPTTSKMLLPLFWSIVCWKILFAVEVMTYPQNLRVVIHLTFEARPR
jgi:hypothetical protein